MFNSSISSVALVLIYSIPSLFPDSKREIFAQILFYMHPYSCAIGGFACATILFFRLMDPSAVYRLTLLSKAQLLWRMEVK